MSNVILIAQGDAPAKENAKGGEVNPFSSFLLPAVVLLFFLVVWLPGMRRQKREQQAVLASIKPGMKVVTASGIVGSVVKAKDGEDEITIKSEDTRLRVLRSAIARVLGTDEATESK